MTNKTARKVMMIASMFGAAAFSSCSKHSDPVVNPVTPPLVTPVTPGGGDQPTSKAWKITPIIRTYDSGSEYVSKDANGNLQLEEINFSKIDQSRFSLKATGAGETEWVNASAAVLKKLGDYTYEVTLPNTLKREAVADDTTSKTVPFFRTRVADPVNKEMKIFYTFTNDSFELSNKVGFAGTTVNAANFNSASKSTKANVLSY